MWAFHIEKVLSRNRVSRGEARAPAAAKVLPGGRSHEDAQHAFRTRRDNYLVSFSTPAPAPLGPVHAPALWLHSLHWGALKGHLGFTSSL